MILSSLKMSSTDNIPLHHTRSIIEVDISDDDNDKPIEKFNYQIIPKLKTSKRSLIEVERTDEDNENQPESKKKRTEPECQSDKQNQSTSKTTIEIIDISDDQNDNEEEVHGNGFELKKQLIDKEKQLQKGEKERIHMNKEILEKDNALQQCKKKMIEQEKYIQKLLSAHKNSTKESQLEQPKVIEQENEKKHNLNLRY